MPPAATSLCFLELAQCGGTIRGQYKKEVKCLWTQTNKPDHLWRSGNNTKYTQALVMNFIELRDLLLQYVGQMSLNNKKIIFCLIGYLSPWLNRESVLPIAVCLARHRQQMPSDQQGTIVSKTVSIWGCSLSGGGTETEDSVVRACISKKLAWNSEAFFVYVGCDLWKCIYFSHINTPVCHELQLSVSNSFTNL